jgi:ATP-binding protein involved in chromosome partitioning
MTRITQETIVDALRKLTAPDSGKDIVALGLVGGVSISTLSDGVHVSLVLEIDPAQAAAMEPLRKEAEKLISRLRGVAAASVVLSAHRQAPKLAPQARKEHTPTKIHLPGVKHIVAVASGKGGVGKSTTAVNLAIGFKQNGLKVGLLDADIYGPSIPRMLNLKGKPQTTDDKKMVPMQRYGIAAMSMGFLIAEDAPMIWRGPMVHSALTQMFRDVAWGPLDMLIVDLPPGTGDAQLTMAQSVDLAGAVIVSTPQDIALIDARRGLAMFRRVDVPVLGIIENMSMFLCPHCGQRSDIFGHGGARDEAAKLDVPFLGEIPLDIAVRQTSDAGEPIAEAQPDSALAAVYREMAGLIMKQLAQVPIRLSAVIPPPLGARR